MTPEQKQRIAHEISNWRNARKDHSAQLTGDRMAALLQELVDAPEPEPKSEPVARVTGYYAGYLSIATVDGRVLPAGTALYAAQPAPSVPVEPMENIALNEWLDKTEWVQKELNTFPVSSLGMHRADVMRLEIERLRKLLAAAPTPAEAPDNVARDAERYRACNGSNCGCTDGISHSDECISEHDSIVNSAAQSDHVEHGGWKCYFCGYDGQDNQRYNQFCARCKRHR